jgi:hypothetical protein
MSFQKCPVCDGTGNIHPGPAKCPTCLCGRVIDDKTAVPSPSATAEPIRWQPWIDFRKWNSGPLPIDGPPCASCAHWAPRRKGFDLQICHAPQQERDFSCFKPKPVTP